MHSSRLTGSHRDEGLVQSVNVITRPLYEHCLADELKIIFSITFLGRIKFSFHRNSIFYSLLTECGWTLIGSESKLKIPLL